jgi:ferric-dicitrate binding protein FerR (iron transport regulator)
VNGILPSRTFQLNAGEGVIANEIVKTNADSQAKIVFTDSTNLSVGANSTVKLDKFVAAGPTSYDKATINVVKGAFRFVTGHSDKRAYEIKSQFATIGVRGTIVEVHTKGNKDLIDVREGLAHICTVPKPNEDKEKCHKCVDLKEGESAEFTSCGVTSVVQQPSSFSGEFASIEEFAQVGELAPAVGEGALFALGAAGVIGGGIGAGVATQSSAGGPTFIPPLPASP